MMEGLAERLIAEEFRDPLGAGGAVRPAFRVCDRLRASLTVLTGREGFRALLARTLVLARAKADWIGELTLATDGSLVVPPGLEERVGEEPLRRGELVLVATFLEVLVRLIGVPLTLRLLQDIWPGVSPGDFELRGEHA